MCCSALLSVAEPSSVLQCAAACCSVLQCVAVCCSMCAHEPSCPSLPRFHIVAQQTGAFAAARPNPRAADEISQKLALKSFSTANLVHTLTFENY